MSRRRIEIAAAAVGVGVALYLLTVQLDLVRSPYDPLFGANSTLHVVKSSFSESLPFPDAAAGVLGYLLEIALAVMSPRAHRRAVRLGRAAVASGMAVGGVGLLLVQEFVVHHWCTLCLVSAALSWIVAAVAIPHALASRDHDLQSPSARRKGAELAS